MRARRVTLKTVAESVGVSVNTASRALAGKDAVSEETRALVREEAERLGYVRNSMARSLVLGNAMTLGMVITHPANPFYATLISAVEEWSRAYGYSLLLMVTEENLGTEQNAAEELLRWGVDGAVVIPVQEGAEHWRRLQDSGVPIVLVNRNLPELECDFVGVDHEAGAYKAAAHLLDADPATVYLLEEDSALSSVSDRVTGYRRALRERGRAADNGSIALIPAPQRKSRELPWEPADAYERSRELLPRLGSGTSVMTGNDYFALSLYRALSESGIKVPEQVAVLGFGDYPFSAYLSPPLTSVRLRAAEIGTMAVDLLVRRVKEMSPSAGPESIYLESDLEVRNSTR